MERQEKVGNRELELALQDAQRREKILSAKLKNQIARYAKLEESAGIEDSDSLSLAEENARLREELAQFQAEQEREKRQRNHLLNELAEAQNDYLEVDLKFQIESERSSELLSKTEELSKELEELGSAFERRTKRLNALEQANGLLSLEKQALEERLAAGSQKFREMVANRVAEQQRLSFLESEAASLKERLTQAFIGCERLKEEKETLRIELISQRQRLLEGHLRPSTVTVK